MIEQLIKSLNNGNHIAISGLRANSAAMIAAWSANYANIPVFCVVPTEHQAEVFEQDLSLFTDISIIRYPGYDIPPYTPLSPDPETIATRLAALYQLLTNEKPTITVASCESLLRKVMPKNILANIADLVIAGEETDQKDLALRLADTGYEPVSLVQRVGDFSVRGGIVDVFPPGYNAPIRLDFFGDTIESIRSFDPVSQRSIDQLEEVVLLPTSNILFPLINSNEHHKLGLSFSDHGTKLNWDSDRLSRMLEQVSSQRRYPGIEFFLPLFYPSLSKPLDYVNQNSLVFMVDPHEIRRSVALTMERINANFNEAQSASAPALPPEMLFLSEQELFASFSLCKTIQLHDFPDQEILVDQTYSFSSSNHQLIKQEIDLQRKKKGLLRPLIDYISKWHEANERVILACRSLRHAQNLANLLNQHGLDVLIQQNPLKQEFLATIQPHTVILFDKPISNGFDLTSINLHLVSENELYGVRSLYSGKKIHKKKHIDGEAVRFDELQAEDFVVHSEHGIGTYQGLVNLELHGVSNDFLQILYSGNDKLYVPVDRINCVNKYKGLSDKVPKIDKLGSKTWLNIKNKVKEAVWEVAQDLLALYAKRELKPGFAFGRPSELYFELEESFPFDETAGQDKAINEVLSDLASNKPMDRLLCGDVGYGKTEVAIRAAFKVIEDGFQVAILVPTTVLAEQHGQTFSARLQGFPVQVESLSRFRTPSSQKKILKGLAEGTVDIVIGTHRLLSKDVIFKKLGLLIIDEEHRFGVSHKEKIKKLRAEVDVLTLSATPIPRTLQMSLLGVRDLSVITTPPEQRRSIKTFVARYDDLVIKEAVVREMQRKGQIFVVHNRVHSIHEMARKAQKLVPEARVAVAHGQLPAKNLEDIMIRFINKELDVLVCTTIIESGLDIANANTIIINRADRLGLAEIYQLRGRVGRSSEQSYAYLLVPSLESLKKDAKDRLRAVMDCSDLGGGFKLAMSDLQIRGGGNLLGISQSGHIAAVGYDLYLELLQKTVSDLKDKTTAGEAQDEEVDPEINLQISGYIPESYIQDIDQRYVIYRRISMITDQTSLHDLKDELQDRYGAIVQEVRNLFEIVSIKEDLKKLKVSRLEQGKDALVFTFLEKTPVSPQKILELMQNSKDMVRFTPDSRLVVKTPLNSIQSIFSAIHQIVSQLKLEA